MKRYFAGAAALLLVGTATAYAQTGTGTPNGAHYNLNIIGVENPKNATLTGSDRRTIFVALGTKNDAVTSKIYLTQGPFTVCDGNAFDTAYDCSGQPIQNQGAVFQLPCNENTTSLIDCTGFSESYEVWARALGQPGGSTTITTCAFDLTDGAVECDTTNQVLISRNKGKPIFTNVIDTLTTFTDPDSHVKYPLFAAGYEDFFWQYDNKGLRLLQLRLYNVQ